MCPSSRRRFVGEWRAALGFSERAVPAFVFVLVGIVLGPDFFDVLSVNILPQFDPAISVTLAVLGVFVGSELATRVAHGERTLRWVTGATAQASITFCVVTATMYLLLRQWGLPLPVDALAGSAVLGLCSAVSATVRVSGSGATGIDHIADLDDLLLVALGAFAVAWLARGSAPITVLGLTIVAGIVIAIAGAVLFEFSGETPERGVFVIGTVVLLGGAAAYAGTSPLLSGAVAGLLWAGSRGSIATLIESDLRKLQHPFVGILLVVAGASIQFSNQLLWLAAPLVLFRLTGKLIGSLVTARLLGLEAGLLATHLAPPGILSIALALNVQHVLPTGDNILVSVVTASTVTAELLAVPLVVLQPLALQGEETS